MKNNTKKSSENNKTCISTCTNTANSKMSENCDTNTEIWFYR